MEGIIAKQHVYILIEHGYNLVYVSPQVVEACVIHKNKHAKSWLVELATKTKIKVGFWRNKTIEGLSS
jgi:hypothetical protein